MTYQNTLANSQISLENHGRPWQPQFVAETKATGLGIPSEAANQPLCSYAAFFASGVPLNGGPGGAAAMRAGASPEFQLRSVCHPVWNRDGGIQTVIEANTMARTKRTRASSRFTLSTYSFIRRFAGPVVAYRAATLTSWRAA